MVVPEVVKTDDRLENGQAIVDWLGHGSTYPERPTSVETIETHISWVFLTTHHAYKLKKSVQFDFLDFSTVELREQACREELRLNRRLAPKVYLDVVPITRSRAGRFKLGGTGMAVDWVVKMRRLPADRSLDQMIRTGRLTPSETHQLASLLTDFYQHLPPLTVKIDDYRRQIESHIEANRHELLAVEHHLPSGLIRGLHAAQLRVLRLSPHLLDDRVRDGRIVDGHGDLRPEHVYFNPNPTIIDCIEFNDEFRSLDVLDELSFLAMECDLLGAEFVGGKIIERYLQLSGDRPANELINFYKLYRACVRAKVLSLRSMQVGLDKQQLLFNDAINYLRLGETYADAIGPPLLLVIRGLPGTGKSTLAGRLAQRLGIDHLQTDAIRRQLFDATGTSVAYGTDVYRPEMREKVYSEMFRRAGTLLDNRQSIVLDGTFLSAGMRQQAVALAHSKAAKPLIIRCECPDDVAIGRIQDRRDAGNSLSDTRPEFFRIQREADEADSVDLPVLRVFTSDSLPELERQVFAAIGELIFQ